MTAKPIAFAMPELRALDRGHLRFFRRLEDGVLKHAKVGELLWIREPFVLPTSFDGMRPTQAQSLGAQPVFLDALDYTVQGLKGNLRSQRSARELCRVWHRRHLVITQVQRQRLHDITAEDITAAGYRDRHDYASSWSRSMIGQPWKDWTANPHVLRISFDLVDGQVPKPAPKARQRGLPARSPASWSPSKDLIAIREQCAQAFGISLVRLLNGGRTGYAPIARYACAWLIDRAENGLTRILIAKALGSNTASQATVAIQRAEELRGEDPEFLAITDAIDRGEEPPQYRDCAAPEAPAPKAAARSITPSSAPDFPAITATRLAAPPDHRRWCSQCERRCTCAEASSCSSPFCKLKDAV